MPDLICFALGSGLRIGGICWPSNVRRSVRAMRKKIDLDWLAPHT